MENAFERKVADYARAINKYNAFTFYKRFEFFISIFIVSMQVITSLFLISTYTFSGFFLFFVACMASYVATDFFNGIAHMIIDNIKGYNSFFGPFIAASHMHHIKLKYKKNNIIKVYFYESGQKFWLAIYLFFLFIVLFYCNINANVMLFFVLFGVLSSVAEVSHFLCHNQAHKTKGLVVFLQRNHFLLNLNHHRLHHINDNVNYAFLNGMSDPLLNYIAKKIATCGYKNSADLYVIEYMKNKDLLWR